MNNPITHLLRPHLLQLKPYASARHEFKGQAEIYLDANENPFGSGVNRYPDPYQMKLKKRIADWRVVNPNQIFLGNGSDEAIDLLIRLFCRPGIDKIVIPAPTYGMYSVSAQISNVEVVNVPLLDTFQLDVSSMKRRFSDTTKLLFLCSPNNPSGNCLEAKALLEMITEFPGIVVVDEAYIDFCLGESILPRLNKFDNLVVLQTFSKAWGLAGIRLGMAFATPSIIDWMNKIKPPYNVNSLTQKIALEAFDTIDQQQAWVQSLLEQRKVIVDALKETACVLNIYPSDANFVLIRMDDAKMRYNQLLKQGIVVRDRSKVLLCNQCLRISVGTPDENQSLIKALQNNS